MSSRSEIKIAAQIDLSRDEDSVQSLANLTAKEGLITLAGINSSSAAQQNGSNDHFRSFFIDFPKRQKSQEEGNEEKQTSEGKIAFGGKSSVFSGSRSAKDRPYQRLLRLSPVKSREAASRRIGAIATGHAAKNEIVLFNAMNAFPGGPDICARIEPSDGVEAVDLDLFETKGNSFALAYCTEDDVFVYNLTYNFESKTCETKSAKPVNVYSVPPASKPGPRATVRCLRWLSAEYILLLQKLPQGGAELLVLYVKAGSQKGSVVVRKTMPKSLKVAAHLDVCALDADVATGDRQIIIAVAGQDSKLQSTIHVLTLEYRPSQPKSEQVIGKFGTYTVLDQVHPSNIMKVTLSNFFSPRQPPHSTMSIASTTQYVSLASVAWGGTVVVDSLALTSTPTSPHDTADAAPKTPAGTPSVRWVLSNSPLTERLTSWAGLLTLGMAILLSAILLQSYLSLTKDTTNSTIQALRNMQPPGAIAPVARSVESLASNVAHSMSSGVVEPVVLSGQSLASEARKAAASARSEAVGNRGASIGVNTDEIPDYTKLSSAVASARSAGAEAISGVVHRLGDLLQMRHTEASNTGGENHIFVEQAADGQGVTASLHSDITSLRQKGAKTFEQLSVHERELWKKRLMETGHWGQGLPETVLKGVLFSQWAAVVGGGLRDAVVNH